MSLQGGEKELRGERAKEANSGNEGSGIFLACSRPYSVWVSTHFHSRVRCWADCDWSLGFLKMYTTEILGFLVGCHALLVSTWDQSLCEQPRQPGLDIWKLKKQKTLKGNLQPNLKPWVNFNSSWCWGCPVCICALAVLQSPALGNWNVGAKCQPGWGGRVTVPDGYTSQQIPRGEGQRKPPL